MMAARSCSFAATNGLFTQKRRVDVKKITRILFTPALIQMALYAVNIKPSLFQCYLKKNVKRKQKLKERGRKTLFQFSFRHVKNTFLLFKIYFEQDFVD